MTGTDLAPLPFGLPSIDESDVEAVARVLRSGWLSTGAECAELERELSELVDAPDVVAVSSCTAALEIALDYQRFEPGSRVGVPTWTFVSSAASIIHAGATPVLLDVDPSTLNVSAEAVEAAIAEGLDGLVVVHFGGVAVAPEVFELAADAGLRVVEDAAHAIGASDDRGPISGVGTAAACYSFYATKNLTCGEGGALATHDAELAAFARVHRLHGLSRDAWKRYEVGAGTDYDLHEPGLKANLPDVLAALARSQLRRFPAMQARRRAAVVRYRQRLEDLPGVGVVPALFDERSADHLLVVLLPEGTDRNQVIASLRSEQVGTSIHFRPLHTFSWYAEHASVGPTGTAVADRLAARALSLPLHPGLDEADVDQVVDALARSLP